MGAGVAGRSERDRPAATVGVSRREVGREVRPGDQVGLAAVAIDDAFDHVAELAAVALGEGECTQAFDRVVGQLEVGPDLGRDDADEPARLGLDVVGTLAERGDGEREPLDPREEGQRQLARAPRSSQGALSTVRTAAASAWRRTSSSPSRVYSPSSRNEWRIAVQAVGSRWKSSSRITPLPAVATRPGRSSRASVKAPRLWPKRMLRSSVSLVSSLHEATVSGAFRRSLAA